MALFGEREVCPCPALYRASFLEKSQRAEESRTNRISDFRCLTHLNGELSWLYLETGGRSDRRRGAQSTQLHEAEPMALLWRLKHGGKSLFCSRCLRARDRISSESRSAGLSSLPIQAMFRCTKWPAYASRARRAAPAAGSCFS